MGVEIVGSVDQ